MSNPKLFLLTTVAIFLSVGLAIIGVRDDLFRKQPFLNAHMTSSKVAAFANAEAFRTYLAEGATLATSNSGTIMRNAVPETTLGLGTADAGATKTTTSDATRVSTTNVQVAGIDEPDIVKTDGRRIFISNDQPYFRGGIVPMIENVAQPDLITIPPASSAATSVVDVLPPESLAKIGTITESGSLLLDGSELIVLGTDKLVGYDVSVPAAPKQNWTMKLDDTASLVTARLRDHHLYLVTQTTIRQDQPCPITPITLDTTAFSIPCGRIYHPVTPVAVDTTFSAMVIDPANGAVGQSIAFVGSSGTTTVYMSDAALYVASTVLGDMATFFADFFTTDGRGLLPTNISDRLDRLKSIDISAAAKQTEIGVILGQYESGLGSNEQLKFETDLANLEKAYEAKHIRELQQTNIAKVALDTMRVSATGRVPGTPLNQFALDEFQGALRIATTSNGGFFFNSGNSVNDVYVLNAQLKQTGAVTGLGKGERIYAARFIGNRGYLVTFKQTDPFYVLDLSDPAAPAVKGELKIPGFSSYLEPLSDSRVIGVGQEGRGVKVSLFDVSNVSNPVELAKYQLTDYWTEVSNNHHAFLKDDQHQVVFIPGGNGGYVISYANDTLTLAKAVSGYAVKRAVYINDTLYVIANDKIVALDEKTWQEIKTLAL